MVSSNLIKLSDQYADSIEEYTESLADAHGDNFLGTQLSKGKFQGSSSIIDLNGVHITIRDSKAKYMTAGYLPEVVVLCFPLDDNNFYSNGLQINSSSIFMTSGDIECEGIFKENSKHVLLTITFSSIRKYFNEVQSAALINSIDHHNLESSSIPNTQLKSFILNIISHIRWQGNNGTLNSLDSDFFCWMIIHFLYDFLCIQREKCSKNYSSSQSKIIQRSIKFANSSKDSLSIKELPSHVFASIRSIQYAFSNILNMSPNQFLKANRFNQIRRDLHSADKCSSTISSILKGHQVTNMSRFNEEYFVFFKETPQTTFNQLPFSSLEAQL